jgi:hypothetical protein
MVQDPHSHAGDIRLIRRQWAYNPYYENVNAALENKKENV